MMRSPFLSLMSGLLAMAAPLAATVTVQLSSSVPSPQAVGTSIAFTAAAVDSAAGVLDYQFSVALAGQSPQVMVDYSLQPVFTWTPTAREGNYVIQVIARDKVAGQSATLQAAFTIASRVTGGLPVITATAHPLVALYSAPACPAGSSMYVVFAAAGASNQTDQRPCDGQTSMNFLIGGMLPGTVYNMSPVTVAGRTASMGAALSFQTGAIPAALQFPPSGVIVPPSNRTSVSQPVLLVVNSAIDMGQYGHFYFPAATDLSGNVIWYYSALGNPQQQTDYFLRPVPGGTMMVIAADPDSNLLDTRGQLWREIDLAGNTIRQTNVTRVTEQLNALGLLGVTDFDHDSIRLSNGHTLILCAQEKIFPAGTQGQTVPVDIVGNAIVDLDANLQVAWSWSAFDHMDINRAAILGEVCGAFQNGCVPVTLASAAEDWLHGNSVFYSAASGDLLVSLRHQDWVIKIDYANGAGTGAVLWELGAGGSFTIASSDPYPWFSHQHDAEYELNSAVILSLFDDGNTRYVQNPKVTENSRGMVLNVNETTMAVTPVLLQDLGFFSPAVGSAQRLDNGNYEFDNGYIDPGPNEYAQHSEYTLSGVNVFSLTTGTLAYRDYRMDSLYLLDNLQPSIDPPACFLGRLCSGGVGIK